ncbi:MAG: thiamine pyrophosphate-dependent enzyme, partial [Gammaproteobacteria bacterium]
MSKVASFEIGYTQYLDPSGKAAEPLPAFVQDIDYLISLYRDMVLTRTFDTKAIALQRTGRLGTYPSTLGQEAVSVAMGRTMQAADVFVPMYRECGTQFLRGVRMREILLYWGGDERGMDYAGPRE